MQPIDAERKIIVPCCKPGLSCCPSQVKIDKSTEDYDDIQSWCMNWRENHSKDAIINACDPEFKCKEQ